MPDGGSAVASTPTECWDAGAFQGAVAEAASRPETIGADLFSIRAMDLLQGQRPGERRSRLSGLLVGLELAGARPFWADGDVVLIGADTVSRLYAGGLAANGVSARCLDAEATTLAGLSAAHEQIRGTAA